MRPETTQSRPQVVWKVKLVRDQLPSCEFVFVWRDFVIRAHMSAILVLRFSETQVDGGATVDTVSFKHSLTLEQGRRAAP